MARSQRFTNKIKNRDYRYVQETKDTTIYNKKIKINNKLNRERTRLREKLKKKEKEVFPE